MMFFFRDLSNIQKPLAKEKRKKMTSNSWSSIPQKKMVRESKCIANLPTSNGHYYINMQHLYDGIKDWESISNNTIWHGGVYRLIQQFEQVIKLEKFPCLIFIWERFLMTNQVDPQGKMSYLELVKATTTGTPIARMFEINAQFIGIIPELKQMLSELLKMRYKEYPREEEEPEPRHVHSSGQGAVAARTIYGSIQSNFVNN